jgi:hypothetical protein
VHLRRGPRAKIRSPCGRPRLRRRSSRTLLRRVLTGARNSRARAGDTIAAIAVSVGLAGHRRAAMVGHGRCHDCAAGVFRTRESVIARCVFASVQVGARRRWSASVVCRTGIAFVAPDHLTAEDVRAGRTDVAAHAGKASVSAVAWPRLTAPLVRLRRGGTAAVPGPAAPSLVARYRLARPVGAAALASVATAR